ncbi:hypothetical protein BU23DRAFT_336455 [Bimuria novae-zelandiae CBS 107.79]|uniref:Uncharacterized protein n=1 Tax=Bimuria novae-zelandiae CBS 107.79 TaxID=1447943 RepID=A0A6A5UXQ2_9PLEO|nr:hypothetical protein BU23DRAFT_336455 [Bimuria novae-zelandiae CBS 107.79]
MTWTGICVWGFSADSLSTVPCDCFICRASVFHISLVILLGIAMENGTARFLPMYRAHVLALAPLFFPLCFISPQSSASIEHHS